MLNSSQIYSKPSLDSRELSAGWTVERTALCVERHGAGPQNEYCHTQAPFVDQLFKGKTFYVMPRVVPTTLTLTLTT